MSEFTLKKSDIVGEGGRKIYLYPHYLLINLYTLEHQEWPLPTTAIGHFKNNDVTWYFSTEDTDFRVNLVRELLNDISQLVKLEKFITKATDEALGRLENQSDLSLCLKQYCDDFQLLARVAAVIRNFDRGIVRIIQENKNYKNTDEILRSISFLTKPSMFAQEEMAILKAAQANQPGSALELWKKYAAITTGYYNEKARDVSYYEDKIKEAILYNPQKLIDEIEEKNNKNQQEHQKFIRGFDNPQLAFIASESTYLKDYYKFCINKLMFGADSLFEKVAELLKLTVDDVKNMFPEELIVSVKTGTVQREKSLKAMKENILMTHHEKFFEYFGKDVVVFENDYLKSDIKEMGKFKGRVASMGTVSGQVVIVKGQAEFHKMKKDLILVVVNTSPDYVPIMHLAKGIVAEEGGLTAHVSVTSREFKIPAIVGIRDITKLLKDGDLIKLDTEKGIVEILQK